MSVAPFLADFGVTFQDASAAEQAAALLLRIDTTGRDLETGLLRGVDLARNTFFALNLLGTVDRLPIGFHHRRGLAEALNKTVSALIARHGNQAVWESPGQSSQTLLLNAYIVARAVRLGELAGSDATLAQQMADAAQSAPLSRADDGARLLAQSEILQAPTQAFGQGKTVIVDAWFHAESRLNPAGLAARSPSPWDDDADGGFSFLGYAFQRYGIQLDTLRTAPSAASLNAAQMYLVVSSSATPRHVVTKEDSDAVEAWVKDGGVLVLMEVGGQDEELTQINSISDRFGIHFSAGNGKQGQGSVASSTVEVAGGNNEFQTAHHLSINADSSLALPTPAHPVLKTGDTALMAVASKGRGTVFAVAGAVFSNEAVNGRKALPKNDNFAASIDLAGWLLKQTLH